MGRGKRIKVSREGGTQRREGWMEIGEREDDRVGEKEEKKRETGFGKEGEEEGKRERRGLEKREKKPDIVQLTV